MEPIKAKSTGFRDPSRMGLSSSKKLTAVITPAARLNVKLIILPGIFGVRRQKMTHPPSPVDIPATVDINRALLSSLSNILVDFDRAHGVKAFYYLD